MFSSQLPLRSKESVTGGLTQEQLAISKLSSATLTFRNWSKFFRNDAKRIRFCYVLGWWKELLEMLDTETRISTASSRIWMEQLTFSLPCCHCEARNPWLVAWDKSNWQFLKGAQQHRLSTPQIVQQDLNGAVNMFSSLLPLRSKESVIGGLRQEQLAIPKRSSATSTFHTRSRVFRSEQRSWDFQLDPVSSLRHARIRRSSVKVKTLMLSHCKVLRSMQLATVIKSWVGWIAKAL